MSLKVTKRLHKEGVNDCTFIKSSSMVAQTSKDASKTPSSSESLTIDCASSKQQKQTPPSFSKDKIDCCSLIRQRFSDLGLNDKITKLLMKSWRSSTLKQYDVYLKRYLLFCQTKKMDPHDRNIPLALEFFRKLLNQGFVTH